MTQKRLPQTAYDNDSLLAFGEQENAFGWPKNDLLIIEDGDVKRLLETVVTQQKNDHIGISEVDLDCDMDPVHLYGLLAQMSSTGIGNAAKFNVHWVHPTLVAYDVTLRVIGIKCDLSFPDGDSAAMFTAKVITAKDAP